MKKSFWISLIAVTAIGLIVIVPGFLRATKKYPANTDAPGWSGTSNGGDAKGTVTEEGIALAIVYDTSGSMGENVSDRASGNEAKFRIANRALTAIVDRLQAFVEAAPANTQRKLGTGLVVFNNDSPEVAVKFGPFKSAALREWLKRYSSPRGGTPLSKSLRVAGQAVLRSSLTKKHVLVVTDGMNTDGTDPATVMKELQAEAANKKTMLSVYFVAFDITDKVFDSVKNVSAIVVSAADAKQLDAQLEFILTEKILLEAE